MSIQILLKCIPKTKFWPICSTFALRKVSFDSSVDPKDVQRFEELSRHWWDPNGPMTALHSLNQIRIPFIRDGLISTNIADKSYANTAKALKNCCILEVGCGGGILTEQLARLHATVTGIDPGDGVINVAKNHSTIDTDLTKRITYLKENIEAHSMDNRNKYDAVIVSEVLEHVLDKPKFLECCLLTLKPGGSIFITTFDKTYFSWFSAIFMAEQILKTVPAGVHDWNNFITPLDCQRILDELGCRTLLCNGFIYLFWCDSWQWTQSTQMSYALQAVKETNV